MSEDEEEISFAEVASSNSQLFLWATGAYNSIGQFLADDALHVSASSSNARGQCLDLSADVDGVVANLSSFAAIQHPLQYLQFKTSAAQVRPTYHYLKKTSLITNFGPGNVPYLCNVHGMTMSILDGYVLTLSVVPRTPRPVSFLTKGSAQRITSESLDNFMEETLANSSARFRGSATMKRNNTTSLRRMNIVSNDQQPLLDLVDLALARTSTPRDV